MKFYFYYLNFQYIGKLSARNQNQAALAILRSPENLIEKLITNTRNASGVSSSASVYKTFVLDLSLPVKDLQEFNKANETLKDKDKKAQFVRKLNVLR